MSYILIKSAPKDANKYTVVPSDEDAEQFARNIMLLLKQGAFDLVARCIPVGWANEAVEFAGANGYRVMMERMDDPADPGGIMSTCGTFYFEIQEKKNSN